MGALLDKLHKQLETDYKEDAQDCIKIYDKLKELDNGRVWSSKFRPLVDITFEGYNSPVRRYRPSDIGRIFLKGLQEH